MKALWSHRAQRGPGRALVREGREPVHVELGLRYPPYREQNNDARLIAVVNHLGKIEKLALILTASIMPSPLEILPQ